MLKFYNTLTRSMEEFKPISDKEVTIYTCGPTVYNYVHIGNLKAMLTYDLAIKYLKFKGYNVKWVMNITDVDDKTIRDSKKEGKSLKEFTEFYTQEFINDLKTLNIDLPEIMPKATDEIEGMVKLVKILMEKGVAYRTDDGIYFSISKFKDYGKLAKLDLEKLKVGASGRIVADEYDKENAHDFVLWKFYVPEDGEVFWETDLGKGRPGWHIECSVMSSKYLGQPFDIHMGGVDLIFPHHTNEIAQSEAAYETKFCNYWLHNEHVIVNGEKMSKSLGNFYTLRNLIDKGYKPEAIRYELISTHYRSKMDFREESLQQIPATLQKFYDFLDKLDECSGKGVKEIKGIIDVALDSFEKAMDNDLNVSGGLAAVFDFMTKVNKVMLDLNKTNASAVKKLMLSFDMVLGVMDHEKFELDSDIDVLVKEREEARAKKDFARADSIRDELKEKGIVLEDTPNGVRWKKG